MAFCSNCGNEVKPGAAFCGSYGTPAGQQANAPVYNYLNILVHTIDSINYSLQNLKN